MEGNNPNFLVIRIPVLETQVKDWRRSEPKEEKHYLYYYEYNDDRNVPPTLYYQESEERFEDKISQSCKTFRSHFVRTGREKNEVEGSVKNRWGHHSYSRKVGRRDPREKSERDGVGSGRHHTKVDVDAGNLLLLHLLPTGVPNGSSNVSGRVTPRKRYQPLRHRISGLGVSLARFRTGDVLNGELLWNGTLLGHESKKGSGRGEG